MGEWGGGLFSSFVLMSHFKKLLKEFDASNFFQTLQIVFNRYNNTIDKWSERKFRLFFTYKRWSLISLNKGIC